MPSETEVGAALKERLDADSPEQLEQAGSLWTAVPFAFYYGNQNETIDVVTAETVAELIRPDALPDEVSKKMEGLIGPNTVVRKGITIMWLATFRAE